MIRLRTNLDILVDANLIDDKHLEVIKELLYSYVTIDFNNNNNNLQNEIVEIEADWENLEVLDGRKTIWAK